MRSRLVDTARFDNLKLVKQAFYNSKVVEEARPTRATHIQPDESAYVQGIYGSTKPRTAMAMPARKPPRCSAVIVDD
jgi:hypothetical protein